MHDVSIFFIVCLYVIYGFMENAKIEEKIKTSDDGKGILITNDAIEQISSLLKNQTDKKALRAVSYTHLRAHETQ